MTATATQLRIPFATLPAPVLPGVTLTLTLEDPALRRAIDAAAGGQVAFRVPRAGEQPAGEIVLVAHVPSTGSLPGGAPAAVVQVDSRARLLAVHPSERGEVTFDHVPLNAEQDASVTIRPREPGVYALSPYPFGAKPAEFAYAGRYLSPGQHAGAGWPRVLAAAPTSWERFRLVAG